MWDEKEAKILFQKLPFYNVSIEKPRIKHLKNIYLLDELSFWDEISIMTISEAWYYASTKKYYTSSWNDWLQVEITDLKDLLVQLEANKSSIKGLFKDLLDEIKGLKYQITTTEITK